MSEHQPTSWASFFFDLHVVVPFAPVGIYFLFQRLHDNGDAKIFLIIYGTIAWYFAGAWSWVGLLCGRVWLHAVGVSWSPVPHVLCFDAWWCGMLVRGAR